eukprot:gene8037-13951_t
MNFLRKKFGAKEPSEDGPQLHHLRRLFLEYLHPRESTVLEEQEVKLYQMLPLFLRVFSDSDTLHMSERFSDVLQFAGHISKLLVNEIQRRVSNKTKQRAVIDVIEFLIEKQNKEENHGWNLLSTLNILSCGEVAIVECIVAAALPSAFAKMLNLFFSLKVCYFEETSLNKVQKLILSTFVKLCNHPVTAKELIRTNDLATLFDALTCSCDPVHLLWRAAVSEVLTAITRYCLTKEVVDYIGDKRCIALSISNIKAMCVKNPIAIVEMLVTLICVLRDSAEVSSVLLDSFKECGGYTFLSNLLVDFYSSEDHAVNEASRNLVILISSLALSGPKAIKIPPSMDFCFQDDGFTLPAPASVSGLTVRNLDAFIVLQETFLQSRDEELCLHILHAVQNIYNSDAWNFFVLSNLHTLTQFIDKAPTKTRVVQAETFKLIEFVALHLQWIPTQELLTLGILFKDTNLTECQTVALHTLIRLINQNDKFKNVFREVGILEVLINSLREFAEKMKEMYGSSSEDLAGINKDEIMTDFIFLLMECLRLLIENNTANAVCFRQFSGAVYAHSLISFRCARPYALKIVQQLIVDGGRDDLGTLLCLMHTTKKTSVKLKIDALNSMLKIFAMNGQTRTVFQEVSGFVYVVAVLVSLEGSLADPAIGVWANVDRSLILELIWTIFQVLTAAMQDEPSNRVIFMDEKRRYIKMIVFKCLTSMASSCFENWDVDDEADVQQRSSVSVRIPRIVHPGAIGAGIELLPSLWEDEDDTDEAGETFSEQPQTKKPLPRVLVNVISQLQQILGSDQNQQLLCDAGIPFLLLTKCRESFLDDDHPLNAAMTKLFERLTSQSMQPEVLRTFLRLGSPLCCSSPYAMLRSFADKRPFDLNGTENIDLNRSLNESMNFDERQRKQSISLRIFDGDIRLSCSGGGTSTVLFEENEMDSYLDPDKIVEDEKEDEKEQDAPATDSISVSSIVELDHEFEASDVSENKSFDSIEGIITDLEGTNDSQEHTEYKDKEVLPSKNQNGDSESYGSDTKDVNEGREEDLTTGKVMIHDEKKDLNVERQVEEKPVAKNVGTESVPYNGDALVERKGEKTEPGQLCNSTNSGKNGTKFRRMDSYSSNRMISNDEENSLKNNLTLFYERELNRLCEKLEGKPPSQNMIKCLVSLTTPKDLLSVAACEQPPFVEFDMSHDGFGFLYLGNLAPILSTANLGLTSGYLPSELASIGASGPVSSGAFTERAFPPAIGLTFSSWLFIERLPTPSTSNLLRLFSIQRTLVFGTPGKRHSVKIFTIFLDLESNEIVVTTDKDIGPTGRSNTPKSSNQLRAKNEDMFYEGNWNLISVVLNKSVVRKSTASIYVNGSCIVSTSKFRYIDSRLPSGIDITSSRISAVLGTHATQCHISDLIWRLGPTCLLEDPLSDDAISSIYKLGPSYNGCFQAPIISEYYEESGDDESQGALVPEEKVIFMLNAENVCSTTLAKLKSQHSNQEARAISEETNIMEDDRFTPIVVINNSARFFQGPARTLGAAVIGASGARSFCPRDLASAVMSVGGMPILLSLVAMAGNLEELYASLKALTCIVQSSRLARKEMVRIKGYQILGYLLKRKVWLLNTHILHLIFSLVGTVRSDKELGSIPNTVAFNDLLCNFEIWHNAPNDLEKSLFSHFFELLTQGSECEKNLSCLRSLDCVSKLLHVLQDGKPPDSTLQTICNILCLLLRKSNRNKDLLRFGQFLASTLSTSNESDIDLNCSFSATTYLASEHGTVVMRNSLLDVLHVLLCDSGFGHNIDQSFCEKLHDVLGFDWIMLFLLGNLNKSTVIRAARILFIILGHSPSLNAFKSGTSNGGWLKESHLVLSKRTKFAADFCLSGHLGFAVPDSETKQHELEVNFEASTFKGFSVLMTSFEDHINLVELYYLLIALLLGFPTASVPKDLNFSLENLVLIFRPSFERTNSSKELSVYCPESALVLLHMLRKVINETPQDEIPAATKEPNSLPAVVIQYLEFLYANIKSFGTFCTEKKFLQYLAAALYPLESKEDSFEVVFLLLLSIFLLFRINAPVNLHSKPPKVVQMAFGVVEVSSFEDFPLEFFSQRTEEDDEQADSSTMTNHPCRSRIISFVKHILMDGVILSSSKSTTLLETALEAFPASSNVDVLREYQSDVLLAVINDVLDGSLLQVGSSKHTSLSKYAQNINAFASKLVDKLWLGIFSKDYEILFGFLLKMIDKYEDARVNPEHLFRAMNRAILYHLSRPKNRLTDQTSLLEFLHLLTSNFKTIFSPNNRDGEFIACLTHWLLVIGLGKIKTDVDVDGISLRSEDLDEKQVEQTEEEDEIGFVDLVSSAAKRVWDVFYQQKKDEIADVFRVHSLTPSFTSYEEVGAGRSMTLDLDSAKSLFGEQCMRFWINFITVETKKKNEVFSFPQQQQATRNPVTRISMKFRKEKEADEKFTVKESLGWISRHSVVVKAVIRYYYERHQQENSLSGQSAEKSWYAMEKELLRERGIWGPEEANPLNKWKLDLTEGMENSLSGQSAEKSWYAMEKELLRERGIWGPEEANPLTKWKLDLTEGPRRMRKLMCRHEHFYSVYPYRDGNLKEQVSKNRAAYSHDSKLLYNICQKYLENDLGETRGRSQSFTWSPTQCTIEGLEGETPDVQVNSQTIVQLLETGEKIYSMYRCARLRGLDSSEGLFLFGRSHFYVIDGFTLLTTEGNKGTGDIRDIDSLPEGTHEPLIPVAKGNTTMERSFSKWSYDDMKEVHKRRYLQQNIAMEMFSNDGNNHLLVFPKKIARDKVYLRLTRGASSQLSSPENSIAGMRADADVESGYGFFGGLIGEKHVTQRWERGELSNFQYLMYLNTLAGRSYNDLMQYPIFPWIIADYDSEELDLTNEATFRDLSKPMGAQTEHRLRQFEERYRSWEDPQNKTPPYYYGTHYSSAMIVASYLIRLEPFTEQFLQLQGGHFDLPDRLFHSIKESWLSASEHTMADVKELIPEFFYLPEFLENQNKFDLGKKQNGDLLGDVVLPAWAKNDAREFIRLHRKALECDIVSAHLHEWIDLIFGYRQQGDASIEAHNVFYHMFYAGAVDLSQIKDPLEKKSAIAVINNFGQMPKQLFKRPHPCKKTLKVQDLGSQTGTLPQQQTSLVNDRLFFNNLSSLVPSVQPVKELRAAVGQIVTTEKSLFAVDANKVLLAPHFNRYISWGHADFSLRYCSTDDKILNVFEQVFVGRILCAASLDHGAFVTGGTSTALCVWKIEKFKERNHRLKLTKALYGHKAAITSIATSLTYNIMVTGSEDKTAIIWDVRKLSFIRQLPEHQGTVSCVVINNLTGDIVTCSSTWLYVWSINGIPILHENISSDVYCHILACAVSEVNEWDDNNVIVTGSANGIVQMWSIQFHGETERLEDQRMKVPATLTHRVAQSIEEDIAKEDDLPQSPNSFVNSEGDQTGRLSPSAESEKSAESFILVDHKDAVEDASPCKVWKRKLVLRERKLTMHTAFARMDNREPAPVTALAISKDHRKIFVGDGRGRIYSWSVSDVVGAIADHWVKDEVAERCSNCDVKFSLAERRHHCRKCGRVFCAKCSQDKHPIAQLSIFVPVRVCKDCYSELRGRNSIAQSTFKSTPNG